MYLHCQGSRQLQWRAKTANPPVGTTRGFRNTLQIQNMLHCITGPTARKITLCLRADSHFSLSEPRVRKARKHLAPSLLFNFASNFFGLFLNQQAVTFFLELNNISLTQVHLLLLPSRAELPPC